MSEDEKQTASIRLILLVTPDEKAGLDELAAKDDRTLSYLIRKALEEKYPKVFRKR